MNDLIESYVLVAVEKEINRIAWISPYKEWPRLRPLDPYLSILSYRGIITTAKMQNIYDFQVTLAEDKLIQLGPVDAEQKSRLVLLNRKCAVCYRWLSGLHLLSMSVDGYIPDVPLGRTGTNDRMLFEQERTIMREIIATEIANNHHLIWDAVDIQELERIAEHLGEKRHRNQQAI
jgi:hypothetical protein